jgi:hypothetical protein
MTSDVTKKPEDELCNLMVLTVLLMKPKAETRTKINLLADV